MKKLKRLARLFITLLNLIEEDPRQSNKDELLKYVKEFEDTLKNL